MHVHGCSLVLRPLPPPTWPGNEASMVSLAGICCSAICIPPGERVGSGDETRAKAMTGLAAVVTRNRLQDRSAY